MAGEEVAEELPRELNPSNAGPFLIVEKNKLAVKYTGSGSHNDDVGSIQANCAVPRRRRLYYYEITVKDAGDRGCIAIGFAPPDYKAGRQPGWKPGSYGYHGDDGRKYWSTGTGEEYGPHFGTGDTVGAGLHLETQELFFTKNGEHLGSAYRNVVAMALVPTIGLHSLNEEVEVNFGSKPFKFDLDGQLQQERDRQAAAIAALHVPAGVTHQLVRQYLLHFGYADTLRAFDSAAGVLPDDEAVPADSPECPELALRHAARKAIDAGDVWEAERLIQGSQYDHLLQHPAAEASDAEAPSDTDGAAAPEPAPAAGDAAPAQAAGRAAAGGGSAADAAADVHLHLSCQKFVELVRESRIDEAVAFGRKVLSPLMRVSPAYGEVVMGVFALIAYQDPGSTSLADLLSLSAREATADVLNAAVLAAATPPPTPSESVAMDSPEAAQPPAATRARGRRGGPPPPPPAAAGIANGSAMFTGGGGGGRRASTGTRGSGRNGGGGAAGGGGLAGVLQSAQALVGMGLEDAVGAELADEMGAAIMAMDPPPAMPHQQQQQQQQSGAGAEPVGEAAGGGGSGAGPALPQQPRRPPPRPTATLQRLLAQLVVVRQQMHEANGGQGEVFRLSEHMAPPEVLKPKTA